MFASREAIAEPILIVAPTVTVLPRGTWVAVVTSEPWAISATLQTTSALTMQIALQTEVWVDLAIARTTPQQVVGVVRTVIVPVDRIDVL